ncbi:ATP-binding protein [Magnetospirillum sp. UT-4]|uniref:PAS domain-containing sensor histidine kinase n=1 Tax=Magnetospirillum sp. UT-4 TaxID=2681467 RepID=UPI00137D52BF|nr:ATP-binding protein [Magnetospirillum sp. UT-4]CAA7620315.1 putative Histidine kinase [Magnetospirillum sp. UT-4]
MDDDHHSFGGWNTATLPSDVLASFLDALPAPTAILDHDGFIITVNAAWRRFATENGGNPEGWRGVNYLEASACDDQDSRVVAWGLASVLGGRAQSFQHDYPCHGNGERRWFRCVISALASDVKGRVGASVMHVDISEQKAAQEQAQEASRAKSDFLAGMSHELRTPLNAVIGFAEMIRMGIWGPLGDPRYVQYAADIQSAGNHLLSLINDILDLSKVEAGRFDLREETLEVGVLVPDVHAMIAVRAERAGHTLAARIQPGVRLRADGRLVRQILLNMLSNAIKFTPDGGRIETRAAVTPEGWLHLGVSDTGIGIAPKDIAFVLEPFGQVDSLQARRHSGESTGLGLPLCKRFVELHDGRLHIESTPGTGTTVAALFPPVRVLGP